MFFVDANVFVELQLNQKKADDCEFFLEKIRKGEIKGLISDFIFYSIVVTIENKSDEVLENIKKFVEVLSYEGLSFYRPSLSDFQKTEKIMNINNLNGHFPILVAEDDPISRKILKRTLIKEGHEVVSVENGRKAFKLFKERFFQLF